MGNKQGIRKKSKDRIYLFQTCEEHEGSVNCMDVSEDGSVLATGSDDKMIRLWSAKTEIVECIGRLEGHDDYITSVTILDNYLISTSADKTIRKWLLSACECLIVFFGHESTVNKITYSSDYIFSISYDKKVKCWDFDSGECVRTFTGHKNNINSILFISGERDAAGFVITHKISDKRRLANKKSKLPPLKGMTNNRNKEEYEEEYKENGCQDIIITGSLDSLAKSWSVETGKCIHTFTGHTGPITCIACDLKKETLFTGSSDHSIRSWDIASGQLLRVFSGHHTTVLSLAVYY
jgi:WD40 repeat protein